LKPIALATWKFGLGACEETINLLLSGTNALDAVEKGIRITEDDPTVDTVGYGGAPNAEGIVELDAGIMWGPGRRVGAVAGLRDIREAISVARRVMECTPHNILVGQYATEFAVEQGFERADLLTEQSRNKWEEWKKTGILDVSHDTVCVLALDGNSDLCAGTSTSGLRHKLPGRVGDTPLVGSGFYCDNEVGAAAATGIGEDIMRYVMSFRIVELMRNGMSPLQACNSTIEWALFDDPSLKERMCAVIAIDSSGEWGASATKEGFTAVMGCESGVQMVSIKPPYGMLY
jgi:N4-(beta-N-acetylglucosaminyl)-L-asparaginase